MNNPSHKQKPQKEDAPDWYIQAYRDDLAHGMGLIIVYPDKEPRCVPIQEIFDIKEILEEVAEK